MNSVRAALIKNDVVINLAKFKKGAKLIKNWVLAPDEIGIGWGYKADKFIKPIVDTPSLTQEEINEEQRSYLRKTDWYIIREIEVGVLIPSDIKKARDDARSLIVDE